MIAFPKTPSTRNQDLRDLAKGEDCCGCMGLHCDPQTTVWAHSNALADGKGMGYKSRDACGAFVGYHCHKRIDEGKDEALFRRAQFYTRVRLAEIACNPTMKPWRVKAARWALEQINSTKELA